MSTDSHPLLPWYDYDEVAKVEIRKGSEKVDRFMGFETEEDIKRKLQDLGMHGTFSVIGIDDNGTYMPNRGELMVPSARAPLSNFLQSSHYKSSPAKGAGGFDASVLLDHEAQRQREVEEAREKERRKLEKRLEDAREREELAHSEEKERMEELYEERMRLERESRESAVAAAEERIQGLRSQQSEALSLITGMFEAKSKSVEELAQRNETTMATVFAGQVQQSKSEAELWRQRANQLEADTRRLYDELRDTVSDLKDTHRDELAEQRLRWEERMERLDQEHRRSIERVDAEVADREKTIRKLEDKLRVAELELTQLTLIHKLNGSAGPSADVRELKDLMEVAQGAGVDPTTVLRNQLGWEDAEKSDQSMGSQLLESLGPTILKSFTGGSLPPSSSDDTTQTPQLEETGPLGFPTKPL